VQAGQELRRDAHDVLADNVSVEGDGKGDRGQGPVIKKSEDWVADKPSTARRWPARSSTREPRSVRLYFTLDVTPK